MRGVKTAGGGIPAVGGIWQGPRVRSPRGEGEIDGGLRSLSPWLGLAPYALPPSLAFLSFFLLSPSSFVLCFAQCHSFSLPLRWAEWREKRQKQVQEETNHNLRRQGERGKGGVGDRGEEDRWPARRGRAEWTIAKRRRPGSEGGPLRGGLHSRSPRWRASPSRTRRPSGDGASWRRTLPRNLSWNKHGPAGSVSAARRAGIDSLVGGQHLLPSARTVFFFLPFA